MKNKTITIISAIAVSIAFVSCDGKKEETQPAATQPDNNSVAVMEQRFTTTPPTEFVTIEEARKIPANENVTVKGTLLGREKIFVDGAAMFIIGDPDKIKIEAHAGKEWTACCTAPEIKNLNTMTVQFVDRNGNLVMKSARGINGLKELDAVIIAGKMDPSSTPEAPILNIETISIIK